jgi:hypothetical protein
VDFDLLCLCHCQSFREMYNIWSGISHCAAYTLAFTGCVESRSVNVGFQARCSAIKSPAVTGTTQTGSMMAAVICNQQKQPFHSTVPQQSGSSQGLDSGLQSDGKAFLQYEVLYRVTVKSEVKYSKTLLIWTTLSWTSLNLVCECNLFLLFCATTSSDPGPSSLLP